MQVWGKGGGTERSENGEVHDLGSYWVSTNQIYSQTISKQAYLSLNPHLRRSQLLSIAQK